MSKRKRRKKQQIATGGDYASAALGMLDPDESVQPLLLRQFDVRAAYQKHLNMVAERYRELYATNDFSRASMKSGNQRRRARKINAEGRGVTPQQWLLLIDLYGGRCAYCGKTKRRLTQDHIIPLSRGGAHDLINIVPACRSCNARKNARTPNEADMPPVVIVDPDDIEVIYTA